MDEFDQLKTNHVAFCTSGHSDYDDDVWAWLCSHESHFTGAMGFDFHAAWGLLILCGCRVSLNRQCREDMGSVTIDCECSISDLIRRMDWMFRQEQGWPP